MAEQLKPSSLWSKYSMLKASLTVKDDTDIKSFSKLTAFLKRKSTGYRAEKSKTFSRDEIIKFLLQAPDDKYLMMKVNYCLFILIFKSYIDMKLRSS